MTFFFRFGCANNPLWGWNVRLNDLWFSFIFYWPMLKEALVTTPVSSFHFCLWLLSRTVQWRSVPSCLEGNIKLFFLVLSYQSLSHVAVVVRSSSHPITRLSSHKRLYHLVYYHPQIPFRIKRKIQTWSFSRRRAFNFSGKLHTKLKFSTEAWLSFFFSRQQFLPCFLLISLHFQRCWVKLTPSYQ